MAGSGGVRLGITQQGFKAAQAQLQSLGRSIDPVLRGALDATAVEVRKRRYTPFIAPMFKARSWVNKRIVIKRVNLKRGRIDARIIPSSAGVYVTEFRRWGYQTIAPTRARILVGSFKGHKVAAGFVNPASEARQPWRTRSEKARSASARKKFAPAIKSYRYGVQGGGLDHAMGPSIAWFFKRLTNVATMRYANRHLNTEFQRRLRKELLKGQRRGA